MSRKVFIASGANTTFLGKGHPDFIWKKHPDFGTRENPSLRELLTQAVHDAAGAVNADISLVDRGFIGNFVAELFINQGHLGAALAGVHPALEGKPTMRVEGACASGGLAMLCGMDAIRAGADVVLVAGAEVQTTQAARVGGDYLARAADYARQRPIDDFTFPALFARRTKAYRERYGTSEADIGLAAVKAYSNANRNPKAHMIARRMTLEEASAASEFNPNFLSNAELAPYLKVSDCSQVSDGASAMLLASEEGLARLGVALADAVEIVAAGHSSSSLYVDGDPTALDNTRRAAERAYAAAGVKPQDIEVAEVHDCFTLTELLMMEALGWAEAGQGARLLREGQTQIDGKLPVNTGGGLVGFGHPVGATGVKQAVEIFRQMRGQAGAYQMPRRPRLGLAANMGGDDKTSVVTIFRANA